MATPRGVLRAIRGSKKNQAVQVIGETWRTPDVAALNRGSAHDADEMASGPGSM